MEAYEGQHDVAALIMFANVAVSLSVLMTYPLQLFPAIELLGPVFQQNKYLSRFYQQSNAAPVVEEEDKDLSGFEPLPAIFEHEVASLGSLPEEHNYGAEDDEDDAPKRPRSEEGGSSMSGVSSVTSSIFPRMIMPGDSPQLRATLVLFTYAVAVVVPNVQALISLAGALAGSSIALIIPPILELAYIDFLEHLEQLPKPGASPAQSNFRAPPSSPHLLRTSSLPSRKQRTSRRYLLERAKCYLIFGLGSLFMCLGTYFSLVDIVNIYIGAK